MTYKTLTLDDTSVSANVTSGASFNFNHVVSVKSDRMLIVVVTADLTGADNVSVTYDGVSMNELYSYAWANQGNNYICAIYYLANPNTGTNSVAVSVDAGQFDNAKASALSFYNASPVVTQAHQSSSETDPWDFNITTTVPNCYLVDALTHGADNDWEAHAPQTELYDWKAASYLYFGSSYRTTTTVGSYEMQWDRASGSDNRNGRGVIAAVAPKKIGGAAVGVFFL